MAVNFPGSLDTSTQLPQPSAGQFTNSPSHAGAHDNESLAIIAVETKLGTGASTPSGSNLLVSTGTGTSAWSKAAPTGTIVGTTDSQTLTNKTLTSPTINAPTITNATITADAISGFTTSNSGTIYGISVTSGALASATVTANPTASLGIASKQYVDAFKPSGMIHQLGYAARDNVDKSISATANAWQNVRNTADNADLVVNVTSTQSTFYVQCTLVSWSSTATYKNMRLLIDGGTGTVMPSTSPVSYLASGIAPGSVTFLVTATAGSHAINLQIQSTASDTLDYRNGSIQVYEVYP